MAQQDFERISEMKTSFWIEPPESTFVRNGLDGIRQEAERTGVIGQKMKFGLPLSDGSWHLSLTLDAGSEDISTLAIKINNKQQDLHW